MPPPTLNFMLANWYSGATLFALLVSRHTAIECNGETFPFSSNDLKDYDCTCGEYQQSCEFFRYACSHMWNDELNDWDRSVFCQIPDLSTNLLLNRILRSGNPISSPIRSIARKTGAFRGRERAFVEAHLRFYQQALDYSGRRLYLDGTKSIRRVRLLKESTQERVRIVHLVRDGRAFANSYRKNRKVGMDALPQAATYWNEHIRRVDELAARSDRVQLLSLRYEDLCRTPDTFLRELFQFLDLPYEDVLVNTREDQHVLGNRMRRNFSNEIKEDQSWKQQIEGTDQDMLSALMRPALERFRYI
jgi:hypothetical protein